MINEINLKEIEIEKLKDTSMKYFVDQIIKSS